MWELGAEVIKIGVEPNGRNINQKCGSTAPDALIDKVREVRADIGIALDGDADRVVIVDETGQIVDGDQLMAVIAESWHRRGRLAAGGIVATVMSTSGLSAICRISDLRWCARPSATVMSSSTCASTATTSAASSPATSCCRTSRRRATGSSPRCRFWLSCVSTDKPVSEVCARFQPLPQLLQNVRYARTARPLEDDAVLKAIEAGKTQLGNVGRLVIRPSGTEPVIRVMAEGDDEIAGRARCR